MDKPKYKIGGSIWWLEEILTSAYSEDGTIQVVLNKKCSDIIAFDSEKLAIFTPRSFGGSFRIDFLDTSKAFKTLEELEQAIQVRTDMLKEEGRVYQIRG